MKQIEKEVFYTIPGFSNYEITKRGKVRNKKSMRVHVGAIGNGGYINHRLSSDKGSTVTNGLHRYLAITFLKEKGLDISKRYVNHINGDKLDNDLSNLEWVTPQKNCEHAGSIGITNKCTPITVFDVENSRRSKFPSIIKCAMEYGVSKDFISWRVCRSDNIIWPEGKMYKRGHGDLSWPNGNNISSKGVSLKKLITGEEITFIRARKLAEYLDKPESTICVWLKRLDQPVLPGLIQIKKANENIGWRLVKDVYLELSEFTKEEPVIVLGLNGEYKVYTNSKLCAQAEGLLTTTLHNRLAKLSNKWFNGKRFVYYKIYKKENTGFSPLHE